MIFPLSYMLTVYVLLSLLNLKRGNLSPCLFKPSLTILRAWRLRRKLTRLDGARQLTEPYFFFQPMIKPSSIGRLEKASCWFCIFLWTNNSVAPSVLLSKPSKFNLDMFLSNAFYFIVSGTSFMQTKYKRFCM